jgi:proline iminopeptidase
MPDSQPADSETVLHGRIYINPELQEVPDLPPLCESAGVARHPVTVGDCELFCEVQGEGTPLVLLHGGPGGTHHCFHHSFARASGFAKVIYYDQRGCGQSGYVPGETGYTIDQAVADLDAVRESLGAEAWVVLGYSYGGLLAQCYTVKHPDRVSGLVLVGSTIPASTRLLRTRQYDYISYEERKRIREIQRTKGLSLAQNIYNTHLNGDWKRQHFHRPTRELLALGALYEWKHDRKFRSAVGSQAQSVDLRGAFDQCPIPTLIAEGRWDLTWNVDKPGKLHALHPEARLEMFEQSGHSPFDDEPDRFFEILKDLVGQAGTVSPGDLETWRPGSSVLHGGRSESCPRRNTSSGLSAGAEGPTAG